MAKKKSSVDVGHMLFLSLLAEAGIEEPRSKTHPDDELVFAKNTGVDLIGDRKWRFDYAWPDEKIAIERDGGIWKGGKGGGRGQGGHSGGKGQLRDMEKQNAAMILGWRVLRFTPDQMVTALPVRYLIELMGVD